MAKWKYVNERKPSATRFLRFEEGKPKTIVVTNWLFERSSSGYLFKCYVEKEDGEPVDIIWCVWDYESTERLKKKLKPIKYISGSKELTIVMTKDEDEQQTFEVK